MFRYSDQTYSRVAVVLWMETNGASTPEETPSEGKIMGYNH